MEKISQLKDIAKKTLKELQKGGAQQSRVKLGSRRNFRLTTKNGETELLKESHSLGLGLTIYCNNRFGVFSTSDINEKSIENFAAKAISMVKLTDQDKARRLPDKKYTQGISSQDLQLHDPVIANSQKKISLKLCEQITQAAKKAAPEAVNVQASYSEAHHRSVLLTSQDFEGDTEGTMATLGATVYIKDQKSKRQSGWDWRTWRHWADMKPAEEIGKLAAERALSRRGAEPTTTGKYPVVIVNYWADYLVRMVMRGISGATVFRKMSCLGDKKDKIIASNLLTLMDEPFIPRAMGSRKFDGEGMVSNTMPILENGVLKNYYFDSYWARKAGIEPTSGGPSNVTFKLGSRPGLEMIKDLELGIFITNFIGGNFNSVSGDFSTGIMGHLVEKGRLTRPVCEMNIAGNLLTLLKSIKEIGNDPYPYMAVRSPAIRLAPIMVSGV